MELSIFWFLVILLAVCMTPMLPFFGEQAVRLIRESWDGIIKADPTGNIKPHGAQLLSEELIAMFDDNIPQTQNAPITLNQQANPDGTPGPVPLTINNPLGGHALDINGGTINLQKGAQIVGAKGSSITVPNFTVNGSMNLNAGFYLWNGVPLMFRGGVGGTTVFLGQVVSGSGDTYEVDLFGHGSGKDATLRVIATVPQIHPDEEIPAGTWLAAVHQFVNADVHGNKVVTYEFQPSIWLS